MTVAVIWWGKWTWRIDQAASYLTKRAIMKLSHCYDTTRHSASSTDPNECFIIPDMQGPKNVGWALEKAQWLTAPDALAENPGLVLSTHKVAPTHP